MWPCLAVSLATLLVFLVLIALIAAGNVVVLPETFGWPDLASVLLAASALILTAVGAIVAVASVFGYKLVSTVAAQRAEDAARQTAENVAQQIAEEVAKRTSEEVARDVAGKTALQEARRLIHMDLLPGLATDRQIEQLTLEVTKDGDDDQRGG